MKNKYCFTPFDFAIDILLPNRCPACGTFIPWNKCVCRACYDEFEVNEIDEPPAFTDKMYVPFIYSGKVKSALLSMKLDGNKNSARIAAEKIEKQIAEEGFNLITAVPMEFHHKMQRGFNQAEFLPNFLHQLTGLSTNYKILKHNKIPSAQHQLTAEERRHNAENSFSILNKKNLSGKKILLCDDIITTGATISACAKLLKLMGAEFVACAAVAKTKIHFNQSN
ncbi:MAG: hypothetical protein LBM87_03095 [Ruminococcus sp.]|jgi:competence protein ComFC|nr:hypothetical protein [Ruminococcus sp.]